MFIHSNKHVASFCKSWILSKFSSVLLGCLVIHNDHLSLNLKIHLYLYAFVKHLHQLFITSYIWQRLFYLAWNKNSALLFLPSGLHKKITKCVLYLQVCLAQPQRKNYMQKYSQYNYISTGVLIKSSLGFLSSENFLCIWCKCHHEL